MRIAITEAKKALDADEVPIGAVIVANGQILARSHNMVEKLKDVTAHAEMMAFTAAADSLGGKYLNDCTLYITLEPCVMCAGASFWTRISRIFFGAYDLKRGYQKLAPGILHPSTKIAGGLMQEECAELLSAYFKTKR